MTRILDYLRVHFSSLASIGLRGCSVLAGFVITYFIGHTMGPAANGQYALVAQTAMFLSIVAVGGMDLAVVRQFSAAVAYRIPLGRRSLLRVLGYSLGAAVLIVAVLAIGGTHLLDMLFRSSPPAGAVLILSLLLLARTTTRLTAAVLRSQDRHLVAQTIEVLVIPGVVAALLLTGLVVTLDEVLYATAAVGILAAGFGIWRSFGLTGGGADALDVPLRTLMRTSLPLWFTAISLNVADWYSLATAANRLGVYDAGLFRVAFQIGGALSFSAMGMYNVFTARISAAVAMGDRARVARLSRAATRLSIVLLAPVVIGLLLLAEPLLGLIGPEFLRAAPLLRIIVLGQVVYVATGIAGLVLAMSGHERLNLLISASTTVALLVTAPIAAHFHGLLGLATLVAALPLVGNLANFVAVYRLERVNVLTGGYRDPIDPDPPAGGPRVAAARADVETTQDFGATD